MRAGYRAMPKSYAVRVDERGPDGTVWHISGRIALDTLRDFTADIRRFLPPRGAGPSSARGIRADLSGIDYLDSSGGLALLRARQEAEGRAIPFSFEKIPDHVSRILDLLVREAGRRHEILGQRTAPGFLDDIISGFRRTVLNLNDFISFTGEVFQAALYCLAHPRSIRWDEFVYNIKRIGVDGLPIVGMISFLLGLIIAFMSSIQLKQFGADIYVASLVAIAMIRELGPVMTAILVAGRSGSAFAAEIGTMKVNEEISALVTMGFDPTRFLVVPRIFAALIVLPVLTLYSDLFAIAGGLLVGIAGLGLTVGTYLQQTQVSIFIFDLTASLIKSLFFAAAITIVGCQRGLQARGGAQAVGILTTSAVVSAISLIIVIDSIFAVVLQYIGPVTIRSM